MNKQKTQSGSLHLVVILIIVLALVSALGYIFWRNFLQPKTDTTASTINSTSSTSEITAIDKYADWKTYTSTRGNFSIKYPSDWTISEAVISGNLLRITSPEVAVKQLDTVDAVNYDVDVSFEPKSGSMIASSLSAVAALKDSQNGNSISQYASRQYSETINSIPASEFDMLAQSPYFAAVLPVGDNYIQISFSYTATKSDLTTTLSQILNSFEAI